MRYKDCPRCGEKKIRIGNKTCWECFVATRHKDIVRRNAEINRANPNSGAFKKGHNTWNKGMFMCSPQWNGGKTVNGRGDVMCIVGYTKSGKAKYRSEHRLVAERVLGRKLKKNECVHHINGINSDNRYENLLICTDSYHTELHWKIRKKYGKKWREVWATI